MSDATDSEAVALLKNDLIDSVRLLHDSGTPTEILANYVGARRRWGIRLAPVLRQASRVWRLGVLLLGVDGNLYSIGGLIRAAPVGRPQNLSLSAEERRAYRAAAERGRIPPGSTINFNARLLTLTASALQKEDHILFVRNGTIWVRWSSQSSEPREAREYITERVAFLVSPFEGS